ncbi:MAG TPA: hypothetical protein VIK25_17015 [Gemmatimonadaceae bacterium]
MRTHLSRLIVAVAATAVITATLAAQLPVPSAAMQWRQIGPNRAGRGRAAAGVATQPNVAYVGFDNGGIWRSTDYGNNWEPIFDKESTGSIGAIAVAPSDPSVIYVGTGAGIIRPDLATGNGVYKSTDTGKTWTHLGLFDSQMIAFIDVDPRDPNRFFVAVLGHPYGPNAERGIFRSTDGGKSFQKVLYRDEYTSGNDVRIDPSDPNIVYATLWQQQQAFWEGGGFGGGGNGIFKSTDGGTTWKPLTQGLPDVLQANIAIAPGNPQVLYAMAASAGANGASGPVGFYKSSDRGEHWALAVAGADGKPVRTPDSRPLGRIGGGDLPTIAVDGTNENVIYSASTVMWRTEDGGFNWSAVRGAPGGDDYQRVWVNPAHPDILIAISDQGGVISANRGKSWSNWYTQAAAAMFHVTTDNSFPYRVCAGQQDSGSACVLSRSLDGMITMRDWTPVNIQEYGMAAPDPRDPDMVYGSARGGVSVWNRRTHQTTQVGPDMSAKGPNGEAYNRNVRTMPLNWSLANADLLFYASNAVWKTLDRGRTWARISPDLTRQAWDVPASAGKYASTVKPSPIGTVTALGPSVKDANVLWAGTDDGNIQVTFDGGAKWANVTPAALKPFTRIFNIEAGRHDRLTAYAAANAMRIDDMRPHFYRTHDGGKTWTEISTGILPDYPANTIREDPRVKGLLYAGTDGQVWVSYDDGDHWQSLRNNMPAISIRDLEVKDDSTCQCSDLVVGTHGRGFWILDNVTPLRQQTAIASAAASRAAYLVKPATALRIRFGTNEPTPFPPEVAAGENPMPGAIIDYFLGAEPRDVKIEILDAKGVVVRTYSSNDPQLAVHPAYDRAGYDKICQKNTGATFCGLPLYWPGEPLVFGAGAGMHRVAWDLRLQPVPTENVNAAGDVDATGAVPGHATLGESSPWAPPGTYTVRLTADGKSYTQPLTVKLDPRVKIAALALAQLNTLSRSMWDGSRSAREALTEARALATKLAGASGADVDAFKAALDSVAPAPARGGRGGRGFGGRFGAPAGPATLASVSASLMGAAMAIQGAEAAPTASQVAACDRASKQLAEVMKKWTALKTTGLAALNAKRKAAGQPVVTLP